MERLWEDPYKLARRRRVGPEAPDANMESYERRFT